MGNSFISPEDEDAKSDKERVQKVVEKLKKTNKEASKMSGEELNEWAQSLSNPVYLKEWYLNPEFAHTKETIDRVDKLNATLTKKESKLFESGPNEVQNDVEDIDYDFQEIEEETKKPQFKVGNKVKIKLVIAEIAKNDKQKKLRKLLSPIITKLDTSQTFGLFHSALIIGPWYLEWNNSSLCVPRKTYSSAAMLAADLEYGDETFDLETTIESASRIITKWNSEKEYHQRYSNCQQFIDELALALGVNLKKHFQGPLGDYLNQLRGEGQCEMAFPLTKDMMETFKIQEEKVLFKTHQELDDFVNDLVEKEPTFEQDYQEHWALLKSFDRAYWLRHFKYSEDEKFVPHDCPFKDPTVTTSFKKEWF